MHSNGNSYFLKFLRNVITFFAIRKAAMAIVAYSMMPSKRRKLGVAAVSACEELGRMVAIIFCFSIAIFIEVTICLILISSRVSEVDSFAGIGALLAVSVVSMIKLELMSSRLVVEVVFADIHNKFA